MRPTTLILRSAGTNCDGETAHAFQRAGAEVEFIHVNRLLENPATLARFQILAFPGGFCYGDDIAAGKILANQIAHHLRDPIRRFIDAGNPVIGICNGFQVLVKTDLLPGPLAGRTGQTATLTNNDSGRFIDRWIKLSPPAAKSGPGKCIWTQGLNPIELPIAHGEGKFVPADETARRDLWDRGQVALVYQDGNPNGSIDDIAGVCDSTGLVFGLMPHPERHIDPIQHPAWTSRKRSGDGDGLRIFQNAVAYLR